MGEVQVCVQPRSISGLDNNVNSVWFSCTTHDIAVWSTSGFSEGLDDQTRIWSVGLAASSTRVDSPFHGTGYSRIRIFNLTYDDNGAIVTCENSYPDGLQRAIISAGMFECLGV